MTKIIQRILIVIAGLILGFSMYYISSLLMAIPWPPPANVLLIRFSPDTLRALGMEALCFGLGAGFIVGAFHGIFPRNAFDVRLTRTGTQCWIITFILVCLNHWESIQGNWVIRFLLLTPISMFLSLMVFMVIASMMEHQTKRSRNDLYNV